MSKEEIKITIWKCDSCNKTSEVRENDKLPDGWINVTGEIPYMDVSLTKAIELCETCAKAPDSAFEKYKKTWTTSPDYTE